MKVSIIVWLNFFGFFYFLLFFFLGICIHFIEFVFISVLFMYNRLSIPIGWRNKELFEVFSVSRLYSIIARSMAERACVKRLQKEYRALCKVCDNTKRNLSILINRHLVIVWSKCSFAFMHMALLIYVIDWLIIL